jgi:hypothetical protein
MKYIYVIISAMLLAQIAGAKGTTVESVTTGIPGLGGGGGVLPPHFGNGSNTNGAKGEYKLVAKTFLKFHNGKFVPVDSVTYSFSNGRNGYTKKDDWNNDETVLFDEAYTYFFNTVANDYDKKLKRKQEYFPNDKIEKVTYTTLQKTQVWEDSARFIYEYDADGKMLTSTLETWQGGAWRTTQPAEITYLVSGLLAEMTTPSDKVVLKYSNDNKLISTTHSSKIVGGNNIWEYRGKTNYTYTGDEVSSMVEQVWNTTSNNWVNVTRTDYFYSGKNVDGTEEFTWNGFNWIQSKKHTYTYDTKGNKLSDLTQTWKQSDHAYVNFKQEDISYNIYNQPIEIINYTWIDNSWKHAEEDTRIRFYYDFPTSVTNVDLDNNSLKAYPVPATNVLNLDISWSQPQDFTVAIIDMQGRVIRQWAELPQAQYSRSIPVADIAMGSYFIKVTGERSQLTERLVITK